MLDTPARLGHFPLHTRNGSERFFVKIEQDVVGAIADGVSLHLNPATQCLLKHRPQIAFFFGEKA